MEHVFCIDLQQIIYYTLSKTQYKIKMVEKMAIVTISSKGQLVIPAKIRKALGIKSNSRMRVSLSDDKMKLLLEPLPDNPIETLTGIFQNYHGSLADELLTERKKDLGNEEA